MKELRIVSLLPAATEMACALGLEDHLVGVTHECDYPAEVLGKPVVVRSTLPFASMTPGAIDQAVREVARQGASLYQIDEALLRELAPTLVLAQDLCDVCAPGGNEIKQTLEGLPSKPNILWFEPKCLADIEENLEELGRASGRVAEARRLVSDFRGRIEQVCTSVREVPRRPRVFCLEWVEPLYCSGHWIPEMVELAGGEEGLAQRGDDSRRVLFEQIAMWDPEIIVVMPCGYSVKQALPQAVEFLALPGCSELAAVRQNRVYAVDANAYFARPGPRVVDGIELLAHLIHPELCAWRGTASAFLPVPLTDPRKQILKRCADCGASFVCGPAEGKDACWCEVLPPLTQVRLPDSGCFCPACLERISKTV
jgi:iron complex transport system substrate-binding protein